MTTNPTAILEQIDEEYSTINIISARDIGSRAWGLNGPHSDYDIGIIYTETRNPNTIGTEQETLKLGDYETDLIEFKAWSLKKFGEMLNNSNSSALLYSSSPITYWNEPEEFTEMCNYGLENFRPSGAIGAHRGKAKSNFWKYLLPTIIKQGEEKERQFKTIEYKPENAEDKGMLTLQPLDNSDGETRTIHATHIGENNWRLIHRSQENHRWEIINPEYDDPAELREADSITIQHPDRDGSQQEINQEEIAPPDASNNDSRPWRWGTNDRTKKRYLYICEALMRADIIGCTQKFAPANFDDLIEEYRSLDNPYTDLPTDTIEQYAKDKRRGNGDEYTPIPGEERIHNAIQQTKQTFQDPENHQSSMSTEQLNDFIRGME